MLTPLDIQNKDFKKTLRGYDIKAVDIFLDEVIEDYEMVYKENIELKDKVNLFSDQIRHYNTLEEILKNTLIVAQNTAEEVISIARVKSQNITDDAEISASRIIELAEDRVRDLNKEYEYLRKEIFSFKEKYQSFIESQVITFDKLHKEIEDESYDNLIKEENIE